MFFLLKCMLDEKMQFVLMFFSVKQLIQRGGQRVTSIKNIQTYGMRARWIHLGLFSSSFADEILKLRW